MKGVCSAIVFFLLTLPTVAHADVSLDDCKLAVEDVTPGMTRGDVEKKGFGYDGGMNGVFMGVRMVANNIPQSNMANPKLCMVTVDFRPGGAPEDVINDPEKLAAWIRQYSTQPATDDVVMAVSDGFLDWYHQD